MKVKLKLGTKINLIVLAIILSLSTIVGVVVFNEITKGVKAFAIEKAKGDLSLAYRYIDNKYPGDWKIEDNLLYKGTTVMNENFEVVDKIGDDTGDTVTIFQGDTRIATNVMKDGNRAIGTQVSPEVVEKVLKSGEDFYGEAYVAGNMYQTAYMPIKNASDEIIGIFYVGASEKIIDSILSSFLIKFISVLVIMVVLSSVIVYWFTRRIKKRLSTITNALQCAGSGDFTTRVSDNAGDELSDLSTSYNQMTENIKVMINEVIETSEQVAASSEELTASAEQTSQATETITESIQQVANGAEHATASVQESATALEEVSKGVQSIAENASTISGVSSQATQKAKEGEELVGQTVQQINAISLSVNESGEVIKVLDNRSKEIGNITKAISAIAEQTNLLALNAAIEAARAGEHGKGFAVVADEVRKLAEQSQQSSSQISSLILEIQQDMDRSNSSIEQVTIDVNIGLDIVQQTEGSFKEILEFMERLVVQINDMAATAEEVSASTEEVAATVMGITQIATNTSSHSQNVAASAEEQLASMEEISASASSLSNMSESLQELIRKFKV
ncbi:methyl-accepting chemotaxis protein [Halalkalibacter hemicellulosilyticus]|uniref:Methyl-accepting chemotaxis protein n=1 Tax=Halalkalibacter hemicellulosilyticusJCM 9152 TaxID=1236971 RepID=W4QFU0_9BACI|nr:methyl-accepting chemotaxis protein [Halalkalibacter hemicellulosilyticus]GAE30513.1 methyl-accepting chemotaxis protein [Halalkalibacter hemicellulosilyticusJCM 9152]